MMFLGSYAAPWRAVCLPTVPLAPTCLYCVAGDRWKGRKINQI